MTNATQWQRLRARASRGTVLIIVLGVLTILSVMGTAFARFMRTELQASKFFELRKKAEQLAHDGIVLASSKLANVAAERHYTTSMRADWTFEHDYATGRPNPYVPAAGGVPAQGFGYVALRDSADVSFPHPTPPVGLGFNVGEISDYREGDKSTLMSDGDILKLKVIECQSQINIRSLCRAPFATFRDTLWDLGVQISLQKAGTWFGENPFLQDVDGVVNGEQVISALWAEIDSDASINPPDNQSFADREWGTKEEFLDSVRNIHEGLNMPEHLWELAQDYITAVSWPIVDGYTTKNNQVREIRDPDGDGDDLDYYVVRDGLQMDPVNFPGIKEMYNLRGCTMPPINVNTASREVLMMLFNRVQGEREYKDVQTRGWVVDPLFGMPDVVRPDSTENGIGDDGQHRGAVLGLADARNDATLKFVQIGPFMPANSTTLTVHTNELIVDLLMKERENRPFTSWNDFDMRFISRLDTKENGGFTGDNFGMPEGIAALPDPMQAQGLLGLIGLMVGGALKVNAFTQPDWDTWYYESCRELLRAALQPTPKVTKFNPDEAYWQPIDALDVQARFAPVCFHSHGLYEVTSLGEIRGPVFNPQTGNYDTAPVASATARAVVKVMDIMRHHSQADFCSGFCNTDTQTPGPSTPVNVALTSYGTQTFPNSVDESQSLGLTAFNYPGYTTYWEHRGAGVPPNEEFGYVQIKGEDRSPFQNEYYSYTLGYYPSWAGTTQFVQHFETCGLDWAQYQPYTYTAQYRYDYCRTPPQYAWPNYIDRTSTANNNAVAPDGRVGVAAFTDCYPDGIHLWGRGRDQDLPQYGNQYAPRYKRYIAGNANALGTGNNQNVNLPYHRGTIDFWVKFQDDWYGTANSLRAAPGPGPDKDLGARNAPQRNSWHADNYFSGLFGGTSFSKRGNNDSVGMQMYIYKDVGMQLKIVRILFAQSFSAAIDKNGNAGKVDDLGDMNAEMAANNFQWDSFPRDENGVASNPNDLGILFARSDAIVFLDSLPFPILPHHWYHFSVAYDSNDDPNNPSPSGEYQSSPFAVAINGFQCRYAQEMVVPDTLLQAGVNDGHEYDDNGELKKAHASCRLNELNPEDRITIGCIERLMLPSSWYAANGINPQLFQFAQNDPAGVDKDKPFRLVAPAEATIDALKISNRKIETNHWDYVTMQPDANVLQYARYNQAVGWRFDTSYWAPSGFLNVSMNPNFPNQTMTDGPGIYYENGFINSYTQSVRPAWIAWQEWRPRWDATRHLGPAGGAPGVPHSTLGGNPNPAAYEPPRSNVAMYETDYLQIFAGIGNRSLAAWNTVTGTKLNSEIYHSTAEFGADPYLRGALAASSMRRDSRAVDPVKTKFIPPDGNTDNVTWYGGMSWPAGTTVGPNRTILYRVYFRRGEAMIANRTPANQTPVLDEVVVGLATPARYLEYVLVD